MAAIHEFFVGLGVDEIRRRGAADDKPLRMVKTLLHELCKHEVRAPRPRQPPRAAAGGPRMCRLCACDRHFTHKRQHAAAGVAH